MKQDLAERVTRLERENRFIKLAGLCALAAVVFLVLGIGAVLMANRGTRENSIVSTEAESFGIIDDAGRSRGSLGHKGGDVSGMFLRDEAGQVKCALLESRLGAGFNLMGPAEKTVASMWATREGEASLTFTDKKGKPRWLLNMSPEGSVTMRLIDARGKIVWSAP